MLFPQTGDNIPRHPSQLYEAGLEGLCLFALLWWASAKNHGRGFVSALFASATVLPAFCRVLPGTGQLSRFGVTRTFARPVAVTAAHFDRHRRFDLGLASLAP